MTLHKYLCLLEQVLLFDLLSCLCLIKSFQKQKHRAINWTAVVVTCLVVKQEFLIVKWRITIKILKFGTPQTIAIIVLKIEKFDVTLH